MQLYMLNLLYNSGNQTPLKKTGRIRKAL